MPNIDTSVIEGFDGMTAEQKLDALLKLEIPEAVDLSGFVKKSVFDAKASEAASLSKQLKEKMTDDEAAKAEQEKLFNDMKSELETLRKDKTVSEYTAKYIALGYDKDLAVDTAKAMADGDMEKVFKNGETHRAAMEKKIKEDLMNNTPKPGGNGNGNDNEKDSSVAQAEKIGKAKAEANKASADVMKHYIK